MRVRARPRLLAAIACGLISAFAAGDAAAIDQRPQPQSDRSAARHYYMDFRARPGVLLGHTIIVYGRLDDHGNPASANYAGLYPADGQTGVVVGSVVPVDASVRAVEGDFDHPATTVYRLKLSAAKYQRLRNAIRQARKQETYWHIVLANCNVFAARIAEQMNLYTPPTLLPPDAFVMALRAMNEE